MRLTREQRRKNRRDDITAILALVLVGVIFFFVGFAEAYFDRIDRQRRLAEPVTMPEIELEAEAPAAMDPDDVELWHEFCECYRDCGLSAEEQLALFEACSEFDIDYFLVLGLIQRETQFRNITGDNGDSLGFCQIQPQWWGDLMNEIGVTDLTIPGENFRTCCAILRALYGKYGEGETVDVLTAYNSGHGGPSEYAETVIANQEYWAAQEGLHQV